MKKTALSALLALVLAGCDIYAGDPELEPDAGARVDVTEIAQVACVEHCQELANGAADFEAACTQSCWDHVVRALGDGSIWCTRR